MARYEIGDGGGRDRLMLERLERARRRGKVLLLDPGSATLCGAMACWDAEEEDQTLAIRTILAGAVSIPSRGMGVHGVNDVREFQRALRELVDRVERRAKRGAVDEVVIAIQSRSLVCHHARGDARISGDAVSDRDILKALSRCARPPGGSQRAILHAIPVQFSVDDRDGILDPRGLAGNSIIADIIWITVDRSALDELSRCAEACGLKPAGIVAAPFAAGIACADERQRGTGYACLDMGASATGVSMFLRGKCIHCSTLPNGGSGVAARISHVLGLDLEDAEKACKGGGPGGKRPEARWIVEEAHIRLFEQIRDLLMEEEFYHMPGRAVLLSGGGAKDPRVSGIAARILSCHVSPARARNVWWPSERAADPEFIGLQGLARFAREAPADLRGLERALSGSVVGLVRRTVHWVSSNW